MKISVIICCYKQGHFLKKAIDSVLSQTYKNYEIVVMNDGSPDDTELVVQPYLSLPNFVYLKNSVNRGLGSSRNIAALMSSGDWLFILDSDDTIEPTYFEKAVSLVENDKTVVYSDANVYSADSGELLVDYWVNIRRNVTVEQQLYINCLPPSSAAMGAVRNFSALPNSLVTATFLSQTISPVSRLMPITRPSGRLAKTISL